MEQDYSKDMVILVTGTGSVTRPALEATLEDFIFGPPAKPGEEEISRDVKILLLKDATGPGIKTLLSWGTPMGMEFKYIEGADDREALENAFAELSGALTEDKEVVFAMLYNPESKYEQGNSSMTDLEIIGEAKNHDWLTTLNLSEALVDAFEGYESTDDRIKREKLEAEFDRQKRAGEPHPFKPSEEDEKCCHLCNNFKADLRHAAPVKKTVAKKAATPRKKAAPKLVEAEDKPLLDAPEKPLAEPHKHMFVWWDDENGKTGSTCACGAEEPSEIAKGLDNLIAKAVERETEKKRREAAGETHVWPESLLDSDAGYGQGNKNELSGTIVMSREPKKTELPKDVAVVAPEEVWQDVAKAIPASATHFTVAKADIIKLNEGMQKMASGFSEILDAYKSIVEGQ